MPRKKHVHLTPEERKALKKQKALEKKQRRAEKKRQLKRDYLGREIHYGKVTYQRYERDWKELLIKVALPRMRTELEFAWHNFERVIDCKDFTISLLMDEIRDSEEQQMMNFRKHSENMAKLLEMFVDRIQELQSDYESEVKAMQDRYQSEFSDMDEENNRFQEYLKTMLFRLEVERRDHIRLKRGEYYARLDEVGVKNQLALQKLRATIEKNYQITYDNMKGFIKSYKQQIKEKKKEHNRLKEQDDSFQEVIAQQFNQIRKFYELIRNFRHRYTHMTQTIGSHLLDLLNEKAYFANCLLTLKRNLENNKLEDFQKLACLGTIAAKVIEHLECLNKKGEMVMTLAAVCRKLETEKEKVLPFPLCAACYGDGVLKDQDEEEIEGVVPEMDLFWQRMGQAYGVHYELTKERNCLNEENQLIIDTHNEYCERLMYPPIRNYRPTVSIPKADGKIVIAKYSKSGMIM